MADTNGNNGDFLGSGWYFPLTILNVGLTLAQADTSIRQSVLLILGTVPGERVMRPEFGCAIHQLVFAPANAVTATLAENYAKTAILRWEPRISEVEAHAEYHPRNHARLDLNIGYVVRSSNVEENLVYPFFLQNGGNLPPDYQQVSV